MPVDFSRRVILPDPNQYDLWSHYIRELKNTSLSQEEDLYSSHFKKMSREYLTEIKNILSGGVENKVYLDKMLPLLKLSSAKEGRVRLLWEHHTASTEAKKKELDLKIRRENELPNIYEYTDYREYLKEFFTKKQSYCSNKFSEAYLTYLLRGSGNRDHFKKILDKKREPTTLDVKSFTEKILVFHGRKRRYFELLVNYDLESDNVSKLELEKKILDYQKEYRINKLEVIGLDELDSSLLYQSVLLLIDVCTFSEGDFLNIATAIPSRVKRLYFDLDDAGLFINKDSATIMVQRIINLLMQHNIVTIKNNTYSLTGNVVVPPKGKNEYRKTLRHLSYTYGKKSGKQKKNSLLRSQMLTISEKGFMEIKNSINKFQKEVQDIIVHDEADNREIYTMLFHFFPLDEGTINEN